MKMRVQPNSIRLRLDREDLAELARTGRVEEAVEFGPLEVQRLVYVLEVGAEGARMDVDYREGRLTVRLPRSLADEWLETDRVGVTGERALGIAGVLKIAVEKDLPCLHKEETGKPAEARGLRFDGDEPVVSG
jgi:hypothetical protein